MPLLCCTSVRIFWPAGLLLTGLPRPAPSFFVAAVARGVQKVLQDYRNLQDIIAILGMDELSEEVGDLAFRWCLCRQIEKG